MNAEDSNQTSHHKKQPRPRLHWSGALLLAACTLPATAVASNPDLLSLSLEELGNIKVSSPTLTSESLIHTPAAIMVFSREEISQLPFDYLHELLNMVPGYQVTRSPDNLFVTSARARANFSGTAEVLVLLDGIPFNDPRSGGGNLVTDYFPLEAIQQVEVIRGPGSVLYGQNAFTGVINIITRQNDNELATSAGSYNHAHLHGLGHTTANGWHLNGFMRAEEDHGDNFNVPDSFGSGRVNTEDPIRNLDLNGSISNQDTRLSLVFQHRDRDGFYQGETVSNRYNGYASDHLALHLEQTLFIHDELDSRLITGWRRVARERDTQGSAPGALAAVSLPSSEDPLLLNGQNQATAWELYWRNDWTPSNHYSIQFGIDWRRESDDQSQIKANYDIEALANRNFPVAHSPSQDIRIQYTAEDQRQILGAWAQYQQQLATPTRLTLSLRYEKYSDIANRFTPRLALVHQLDDQQTFKLLYAEAFRVPSLEELSLRNNGSVLGNPDLKHEIVKTWDAIWLYNAMNYSTSLGWFHSRFSDPVIQVSLGNQRTFINGAPESREGVEAVGHWQPFQPLRMTATFTHFIGLPDTAYREAANLGSLDIGYSHARWVLSLAAIYHAEREMPTRLAGGRLTIGDYWLLNAKLLFDLGNDVQWWLQAKNLLDEAYESPAQGNRMSEPMPNRGRELALGILWRY